MSEEAEVKEEEPEEPKRFIEDFAITKKTRYFPLPVFERTIDVRILMTVTENSALLRKRAAFLAAANRIDELKDKAADAHYKTYETTFVDFLNVFVRHPADVEFLRKSALEVSDDSDEFISPEEIMELVGRITNSAEREVETATKKA